MKELIFKLFLIFATVGCSDYELTKIPVYAPEIEVSPDSHDYGHLFSGKETKQESITISNVGNAELLLYDVQLDNQNQNFEILTDIPESLAPGGTLSVTIEYDPKTFENNSEKLLIKILQN